MGSGSHCSELSRCDLAFVAISEIAVFPGAVTLVPELRLASAADEGLADNADCCGPAELLQTVLAGEKPDAGAVLTASTG